MTGLALEGGAKCSAFTAGVLDYFWENGVRFDAACGVSAGAGCLANFKSGQAGRSLGIMTPERGDRYIGLRSVVAHRALINLDAMVTGFGDIRDFDFDAYLADGTRADFVAVCCETGEAEYLADGGDPDRLVLAVKASCSVPVLCRPVEVDGKHYLDGSVADSVPYAHLLETGCDRVVAVLTRPWGAHPTNYARIRPLLAQLYERRYPALFRRLMGRAEDYRASLARLAELEAEGAVTVIRPAEPAPPKFTNDNALVRSFYAHGRSRAAEAMKRTGGIGR